MASTPPMTISATATTKENRMNGTAVLEACKMGDAEDGVTWNLSLSFFKSGCSNCRRRPSPANCVRIVQKNNKDGKIKATAQPINEPVTALTKPRSEVNEAQTAVNNTNDTEVTMCLAADEAPLPAAAPMAALAAMSALWPKAAETWPPKVPTSGFPCLGLGPRRLYSEGLRLALDPLDRTAWIASDVVLNKFTHASLEELNTIG
mmetsp:Transcript_74829/g.216290  ORF Transcript_74829/g.216290 Transcript_74829/m.216290 type:complete len:205 (+) Transcript_74829:325-939(+)